LTTNQQLLDQLSTLGVFVAFAVISLIAYEVSFRAGRWWQARTPDVDEEGVSGVLVGSLLALMAFLLAVTMSMASDRYDTRRQLVLDEANTIETAYLRAGTIPSPASEQSRALLREYAPLRVLPGDDAALRAALIRSEEIQDELWRIAEQVARADSSDVIALYTEAVSELNVLDDDRITAGLYARVPESVLLILLLGSIASIAIVGYNAGLKGHRSTINAAVMIIALGAVFTLVLDIDRSSDGLVVVNQQPLIDVAERIMTQDT
jgi:hypothetical protein